MSTGKMENQAASRLALLLFMALLAVAGGSLFLHRTPPVLPAGAPADAFSAARAFEHTKVIAQRPHPSGSEANAAVADYIVNQIKALGLTPSFQDDPIHWLPGQAATPHNVLARIAGTAGTGQAVLLMGHYDSVAFGPGAADDGAGVVVLLETMRALLAGPKLAHDVIFLFSDGEEARRLGGAGCRGARAFVLKHPWFKDVKVLLNFDARGNRGPAYMYETPEDNGWLIAQLQAARCRPFTNSFMYEIYRSMPVDSDFSCFKKAGVPGFNMAFVQGLPVYHTALDTPEHLDLGSIQHMGYYALNLTRRLADTSLDNTSGLNQVYFNVFGIEVLKYPAALARLLGIVFLMLFGVILYKNVRRGLLNVPSMALCAVLVFVCAGAGAGIGGLMAFAGYQIRYIYILYSDIPFTVSCLFATALLTIAALRALCARFGANNMVAGVLICWAILLALSIAVVPGASYLAFWTLLFMTVALGVSLRYFNHGPVPSRWALILFALAVVPGVSHWTISLYGLYTCLMVIFAAIYCAGVVAVLGVTTPLLAALSPRTARIGYAALAVATLVSFFGGVFWKGFSKEQPLFTNLAYALDADTGKGWWMSSDPHSNPWTAEYIPEDAPCIAATDFFPIGVGPIAGDSAPFHAPEYRRAPGPALDLAPPRVTVVSDTMAENGKRRLTLHLDSPRGAPALYVYASPETKVYGGSIEGNPLLPHTDRWFLSYSILPKAGVTLVLDTDAGTPVTLRAVDHAYSFPEGQVEPRPEWMIAKPNTPDFNRDPLKSDETIVGKTYTF